MMHTRLMGAVALALTFLASVATSPSTASAAVSKSLRAEYQQHYQQVVTRHGARTPGCNLFRTCTAKPTTARVRNSNEVLKRMLYVPPPAPVASATAVSAPNTASGSGYAGGNYSIPTPIVMCESGGNYGAVNPSSGARGAYQLLPSTHDSVCPGMGWSASDQDRCAAKVWQVQGRGAWVC